jgi:hypothetical protein
MRTGCMWPQTVKLTVKLTYRRLLTTCTCHFSHCQGLIYQTEITLAKLNPLCLGSHSTAASPAPWGFPGKPSLLETNTDLEINKRPQNTSCMQMQPIMIPRALNQCV